LNRLKFAVVIHNHQPVGNFDNVIRRLTRACYRPFLQSLKGQPAFPVTIHFSGPLLRRWEENDAPMLDLIGEMVDSGQVELLMGGFYEPVLASLSSDDRRGQIAMMREYLRNRFGVEAQGLWLTERVWDGEIITDLVSEGVRYLLVDDRHFKVTGYEEDELRGYFLTESGGESIAILPIDEELRYQIPFKPIDQLKAYLGEVHQKGGSTIVYGDDGEKMGGWPGTAEWVYRDGWLKAFFEGISSMQAEFLDVVTCSRIVNDERAKGLCYLPTASYTEMEGWALPAEKLVLHEELMRNLGDQLERYKSFIRGGHWKNFLVKYPEANFLHKKVLHLSHLLSQRKMVPRKVLEELYAAQCNDTYWHGVFGGLYLPHLRGAIWERVSRVEKYLRVGEDLSIEVQDIDLDGREEVCAHSCKFSAVVRPERGGCVSEWTCFPHDNNYCNILARRFEAYHKGMSGGEDSGDSGVGQASIHDIEKEIPVDARKDLIYDNTPRGLFVDRFFDGNDGLEEYRRSRLSEFGRFPAGEYMWKLIENGVVMEREEEVVSGEIAATLYVKRELHFSPDGDIELKIAVTGSDSLPDLRYGIEMSLFPPFLFRGYGRILLDDLQLSTGFRKRSFEHAGSLAFGDEKTPSELKIEWSPEAAVWFYPINTVSQSETDFEKTVQGFSVLPHWRIPTVAPVLIDLKWRITED